MRQSQRIIRNFVKMTPGTLGGQARATQPAMARPQGSRSRPARGTFGGQSRVASPPALGPIGLAVTS